MSLAIRFTLMLLVGGIGCIVMGTAESRNAAMVEETPDVMPCSVFQTRGPLENHHVSVTHFDFPEDLSIVYQDQEYGSGYGVVFMPIYPLGAQEPAYSDLSVLIQINNVANDDELLQRISRDTLTGVALRSGRSLDSGFQELLEEGYPGIDVDACQILHVGRKLPSAKFGTQLKVAGFAMLTGFFGVAIWAFKSDDYTSGGSQSLSHVPSEIPVVGQDLQDDDEMLAYRQQFAERYGIQDNTASPASNESDQYEEPVTTG